MRIAVPIALLALLATFPAAAAASWQQYADCSVSYHIDSRDQELNKTRSNSMKVMIRDQAQDYRKAAIKIYVRSEKADRKAAKQAVVSYMKSNGDRFMTMMKTGKLDDFIDKCPQLQSAQK